MRVLCHADPDGHVQEFTGKEWRRWTPVFGEIPGKIQSLTRAAGGDAVLARLACAAGIDAEELLRLVESGEATRESLATLVGLRRDG